MFETSVIPFTCSSSGFPSLRAVTLSDRPHSVPRYPARIRKPECRPSVLDRRSARPPPHSPPGQKRSVSRHRVTEHAFVSIHFLCTGILARQQLRLFANHLLLLIHHRQTKGSRDIRTDAESKIVAGTTAVRKNDGWFAQAVQRSRCM